MAGGNISPRQKMINMMYLVLIALLALNVSKEIIKAFNLIENSLDNASKNIVDKNNVVMQAINLQASQNNARASAAATYATQSTTIANKFVLAVEAIKTELEKRSGGRKDGKEDPSAILVKGGKTELAAGDDLEGHANYFDKENENQGIVLEKLINKARVDILGVLDKAAADPTFAAAKGFIDGKKAALMSNTSLFAEAQTNSDNSKQDWHSMYLVHSPLAGVMAILSKVQNDARSLEAEVNQALAESVGAAAFKFDALEAVVSAPTSAVLKGEVYEADIILAAYDSKANMRVSVNGSPVKVEGGKGKFTTSGNSAGEYSYKVRIAVPNPSGDGEKVIEGEGKYSVFEPAASISADKLDMIYIGLENPMSITVAGVSPKDVSASATGLRLVPVSGGKYKALASAVGNGTISVSANIKGRSIPMGKRAFRIRPVPNPEIRAGSIAFNTSTISLRTLSVQSNLVAPLVNFIYEGLSFSVVSYNFAGIGPRLGFQNKSVNGSSLAPCKDIISKMKAGDIVQITNIKVRGPGGDVRPVANVTAQLAP